MPTIAEKRRTFRELHETGCFVIPNPWDIGSARYLQSLGFKALATTSSGLAYSLGLPDGAVSLEATLAHMQSIAEATDIPLNADFGDGLAADPEGVAANVRRAVATGVAGISIEDQIPGTEKLYEHALAVERVQAAREAVDAAGKDTILVGRTECYLTRHAEPLKEATRRLVAFAEAGADCLYATGVRSPEDIAALVKAMAPKPLNVIINWGADLTVADLAELGVRRISVGGAMNKAAWAGFLAVADDIAAHDRFSSLSVVQSARHLDAFFETDAAKRNQ